MRESLEEKWGAESLGGAKNSCSPVMYPSADSPLRARVQRLLDLQHGSKDSRQAMLRDPCSTLAIDQAPT